MYSKLKDLAEMETLMYKISKEKIQLVMNLMSRSDGPQGAAIGVYEMLKTLEPIKSIKEKVEEKTEEKN